MKETTIKTFSDFSIFLLMISSSSLVGISINLNELRSMGYQPFIIGLISAITVGIISLIYLETFTKFI